MNRRIRTYALLLLSVGILLAALIHSQRDNRPGAAGDSGFDLPQGIHVVRIQMVEHGEAADLDLQLTPDGDWVLNRQHAANETAVRELIRILGDLSVWRPLSEAEKDRMMPILDQDGVRVRVYADTPLIRLPFGWRIGKQTAVVLDFLAGPDSECAKGTYMRATDSGQAYIVQRQGWPGGLRKVFDPRSQRWRDPVVLDLQPGQIDWIRVDWPGQPSDGFILKRDPQGAFTLLNLEKQPLTDNNLRMDRLMAYIHGISGLYVEDFLTDERLPALLDASAPQAFFILHTRTREGMENILSFYRIHSHAAGEDHLQAAGPYDPNRLLLRVNDEQWALARFVVFNRLMRSHRHFLAAE